MRTVISGFGHALPFKTVDNKTIVELMNTTEEFIETRTGVLTRKHISENESTSVLMVEACKKAIERANLLPEDIDMLIVNTLSPDYHDPSQACLIQPLLSLKNTIPVFDIRAQCSGLLYGMDIARQFIATGTHQNILVCCGEALSKRMDYSDEGRNLSILLGDGAGAVVLSSSKNEDKGILDVSIHADGSYFKLLWTESPGTSGKTFNGDDSKCSYFRMNGKEMFNHAVEKFTEVAVQILKKNNLTLEDIDVIIPHQPNMRILDAVMSNLEIPKEKMQINVHKYGNIASGSLPVTLSEYMSNTPEEERAGKLGLIIGYGSGATWGSILYKF
ncbi:3-oxoacyl-ACP synthase III family protein [Chryseobacterium wangxinyae]|uniref:3-oxoacyl-ACP synthase III family protein n=1 Tax=Chryseobacterium sp. CY353 TaxID=2997334 RepID=UPI00226D45AA|nr:ketoacyl-ACP synthase III [Chryseobacterium sp. CY353]MCY0971057.1 ketoacyl-ACP synthase III [Chryseobacterium sp. CY353]